MGRSLGVGSRSRARWPVWLVGLLGWPALALSQMGGVWELGAGATTFGGAGGLEAPASLLAAEVSRRFPMLCTAPDLSRAAAVCARWVGEHAATDLPPGLLEPALRWAGCSDPTATGIVLLSSEASTSALWAGLDEALRSGSGTMTHLGLGLAPTAGGPYRVVWVVLLSERKVSLEPVSRQALPGEAAQIRLQWLEPELSAPRVVVQRPGGQIAESSMRRGRGRWVGAEVELREPGEHVLEVLADGRFGPEVVALQSVWVGAPPPTVWRSELPAREGARTPEAVEMELLALINRERQRHGLPRMVASVTLQGIARAHSADMATGGFFGHLSPRRGDFQVRFRTAGWRALRAAENLSRAHSVAAAHAGLMGSPAHRSNILARDFTHVGIGAAVSVSESGVRTYLITQVFGQPASRPPERD